MDTESQALGMQAALWGLKGRGYEPGVVYDIGAAAGGWTRNALYVWPRATFVCFEPLAERRASLDELAAAHRGQVIIQPVGVADGDGELSFGVTDLLWDSSFAYPGKIARRIAVRSLDSLCASDALPPPSFVKIDVQGFEARVITRGVSALSGVDFILMECNFIAYWDGIPTLDQSIAAMAELGFLPYEFVDFIRRPLDGAMGQCKVLFARRGHALLRDNRWSASSGP